MEPATSLVIGEPWRQTRILSIARLLSLSASIGLGASVGLGLGGGPVAVAMPPSAEQGAESVSPGVDEIDPALIESSPLLQDWVDEVPNILQEIRHDPSFRTRVRLGYLRERDSDGEGLTVGIEDVFIGRTGLTVSADYQTVFGETDEQFGADLRYHLLPLGSAVNIAPVLGYRSINWGEHDTEGLNVGVRLLIVPARTGAADLSLSQTWVRPGSDRAAISQFSLSAGYALTHSLRLSSDIQVHTSEKDQQIQFGVLLEWLL